MAASAPGVSLGVIFDKEFVEELFKKALQGREKDASAKLTAELERAFSGRKVHSLSAFLSLLIKLLSEQREVKVSKGEQDTNQWRNESSKAEKREAGGEQAAQEARELAAELPEYGYHGKLVVAIPVIVGAIISIVVFCFMAIYCHRTSSEEGEEGSSRGFFSILWPMRCSPAAPTTKEHVSARRQPLWLRDLYRPRSARCIEDMAQKLHDKESSAEDELYYQMLRGEFAVLRVAATDSAA
ncbi:leucine-rich repeat-containing protein 37A-like [Phyllostomus hastatus]|uniref:leucine-rich repeat-containing protein 37A-like n=1 Tax=Phyllostomus hastatus TaxID=9423 RepID=UPI001E6835C9|nr:leucine-rich repeat-containing protein 37A-like [Phyllostomus hastatus]